MNTSRISLAVLLSLSSVAASASDFFAPWEDSARRIETVNLTASTRPVSDPGVGFAPWARVGSTTPVDTNQPQVSVSAPGFRPWS